MFSVWFLCANSGWGHRTKVISFAELQPPVLSQHNTITQKIQQRKVYVVTTYHIDIIARFNYYF